MCQFENDVAVLIDDVDAQVERIWEILSMQQSIQTSVRDIQKRLDILNDPFSEEEAELHAKYFTCTPRENNNEV